MTIDQTHLGRQPEPGATTPPGAVPVPDRRGAGRAETRRGGDRRRAAPAAGRAREGAAHDRPTAEPSGPLRGAVLLVAVTALVALGGGWAVTAATPETFETTAKVLVLPAGDAPAGSAGASTVAVADQVPTWAALAQTPAVLDPALEASDLRTPSTRVVDDVSASPEQGTSIIAIQASASSARDAARLASATAQSLVDQIAARSVVGGTSLVAGSVVEQPEVPTSPATPNLLLNLAVALAVGLAVGVAVLAGVRAVALRRSGAGAADQR